MEAASHTSSRQKELSWYAREPHLLPQSTQAASALSGAELQLRRAVDLRDVGAMVPSVEIQGSSNLAGFSAAPVISIRGLGQDDREELHTETRDSSSADTALVRGGAGSELAGNG